MDKYIPLLALVVSVAVLVFAHLRTKAMSDVLSRLSVVEKQIGLFWGVVEREIGKMIHSPHRPELDQLIEKNSSGECLTEAEAVRFQTLLQELVEAEGSTPGEQTAALLLKAVVAGKYGVVAA